MSKFIEYTTISGRKIKVRSNESKRHYTIQTEGGKFKTFPLSKDDFNSMSYYTGNDWQQFLNADNYLKI